MVLMRDIENINSITVDIFKRSSFSIKFKVKLYQEYTHNNSQVTKFFHNEYKYNYGNNNRTSISLSPLASIIFEYYEETESSSQKNLVFLNESFKNRFIKKISKLITILEAHDNMEINILKVNTNGTYINNNVPNNITIYNGKTKIIVNTVFREDISEIGVNLIINDVMIKLSMYDILEIYYQLKDFNFIDNSLNLINYIGRPELGTNVIDFRQNMVQIDDKDEQNSKGYINPMQDLSNKLSTNNKSYIGGKLKW